MDQKTLPIPKYRRQKNPSGDRAFVELSGRRIYLGAFNSAASRAEYHRLLQEWEAAGRRTRVEPTDLTIVELAARFAAYADRYYVGADGEATNEPHNIRLALKPLLGLYGETAAVDFGPLRLKAVRERMIESGWVRKSVNRHVSRIKRMFRWASENEVLPPTAYHAVASVAGLRYGRSEAKESEPVRPVADATVDATIRYMTPTVAAMVQFQRFTGARAGEVCILRTCDLDMSGKVWTFTPKRHKTEHFGRTRIIFIGPRAQTILKPYLRTELEAYVFSPTRADSERRDRQHAERATPLSCGNKPGSNVRRHPKKKPGDRYDVNAYNHAIGFACKRAFPAPDGPDADAVKEWHRAHKWSSHQLRHSFATAVRRKHGLDVVQVLLGHAQATVSEVYAAADASKAAAAALKIG